MEVLKCLMCGGELELTENSSICKCKYCGSMQTLPREKSDLRLNAYNMANHFFRANAYDKALSLYERILLEDPEDANAYWSCILCKYGVNYVEDVQSQTRKITVNRTQSEPVETDELYKQAIKYGTDEQRELFAREALEIDEIQKGILAISANEEPFDIFISYKETDNNGERTLDSVKANELYYGLTDAGYKVFLSRITLEDKLGHEYEPYIYAAINSAKVMIVLGSRKDYFEAPWVKNEWSRYLSLMKKDKKKILIPAYYDMDPYDMPSEFALLQSQDMSKIGALQDILRGVKKVIPKKKEEPKKSAVDDEMKAMLEKLVKEKENAKSQTSERAVASGGPSANTRALLKRMFLFLEDGHFDDADTYAERVLDVDPECGEAYLGKLMVERKTNKREQLGDLRKPLSDSEHYSKIIRYGSPELKAEIAKYTESVDKNVKYDEAKDIVSDIVSSLYNDIRRGKTEDVIYIYNALLEYKDYDFTLSHIAKATNYLDRIYNQALNMFNDGNATQAKNTFSEIVGYKDAEQYVDKCENIENENTFNKGVQLMAEEKYSEALELFKSIRNYKDSWSKISYCDKAVLNGKIDQAVMYYERESFGESGNILNGVLKEADDRNHHDVVERCSKELDNLQAKINLKKYNEAAKLFNAKEYEKARAIFEELGDYRDAEANMNKCEAHILEDCYRTAVAKLNSNQYEEARTDFISLGNYKDSKDLIDKCNDGIEEQQRLQEEHERQLEKARKRADARSTLMKVVGIILLVVIGLGALGGAGYGIYYAIEQDKKNTTELDGLKYHTVKDGYAVVELLDPNKRKVTIADKIKGKPVIEIKNGVFKESSVEQVKMPDTIKRIGHSAFEDCNNLFVLNMPSGVKEIGDYAFCNCLYMQEHELPTNLEKLGKYAYFSCNQFTTIRVPNKVKVIREKTFAEMSNVKKVYIGSGVETIDSFAFENNGGLSIYFPSNSSLKVINADAFSNTNFLSFELPKGLEKIGKHAFYESNVMNMYIPDTVVKVDAAIIEHCYELKMIYSGHMSKPDGWNKEWNFHTTDTGFMFTKIKKYFDAAFTFDRLPSSFYADENKYLQDNGYKPRGGYYD